MSLVLRMLYRCTNLTGVGPVVQIIPDRHMVLGVGPIVRVLGVGPIVRVLGVGPVVRLSPLSSAKSPVYKLPPRCTN